eukprot:scaffold11102_cov13-Tisochrysis_lutea.AAC.1
MAVCVGLACKQSCLGARLPEAWLWELLELLDPVACRSQTNPKPIRVCILLSDSCMQLIILCTVAAATLQGQLQHAFRFLASCSWPH